MKHLAFIAVLALAGCATTGSSPSIASALTTPSALGADLTLAIQAAEIGLPASDVAAFRIVAPIVGGILIQISTSGSLPNSTALQSLIQTQLSGKDAKLIGIVQALVANPYALIYAQDSTQIAKAAPYLLALGNALETA